MRAPSLVQLSLACLSFFHLVLATQLIESNSLNSCQANSNFTASLFNVRFTRSNNTLTFSIVGVSSINGYITAEIQAFVYGYLAVQATLDPCKTSGVDLSGLCPMSSGNINLGNSHYTVPEDVISKIPSIAYNVPDFDGRVRVYVNTTDHPETIACVEAELSNGKTVNQKAVGWVTAVIAGLGLVVSAVASGLGHSSTAAHVAANALSLFGFFQAQAMIGMTSAPMPPIVESWTQNFQWSMGIIHIGFLQTVCTWYLKATGGTPSTVLSKLSTTSVQVSKKRSLKRAAAFTRDIVTSGTGRLIARSNSATATESSGATVVKGIDRVGFRAKIEETNIFLTGLIFFIAFVSLASVLVALFKAYCELATKRGWMKGEKFQDFRYGWKIILRGILFRLILIGFPQICVLCLWEFTRNDSPAEVVLAVFFFISMLASLGWAAFTVIRLARSSISMHNNPAYVLYSDPTCLNKWGFIYVPYRATAYYFIVPVLIYTLAKTMFIGLAQGNDVVQAIALVILEAAALIGASVLRPWMDKKTNVFNISIAAVNFLNAIFLLFFVDVFGQPGLVTGVMGVVYFVYNAAFAFVLLCMVLVASVYAIVSKNPDVRYAPMRDDRGSFIKSQTQLNLELDALGATARGDMNRDLKEEDSYSSIHQGGVYQRDLASNDGGLRSSRNPSRTSLAAPSSRHVPSSHANFTPPSRSLTASPASNNQLGVRPWQQGVGYDH